MMPSVHCYTIREDCARSALIRAQLDAQRIIENRGTLTRLGHWYSGLLDLLLA